MINIIKTAIITIVISFISGLLLDYYKNLAPRLLCNVGKGVPVEMNGKKIFAYIVNVINVSNKTIHEITLNIQSLQANLKSTDAKITKGLKFDSSTNDNILDFSIPFLSKGDKFSVTVYVENQHEVHNKPVVVIRSPENFKRIDSAGQNGILALLFNIPKSIIQAPLKIMKKSKDVVPDKKDVFTPMNNSSGKKQAIHKDNREVLYGNKKLSKSKKAMIITVPIILLMIVGVLGTSYFKGMTSNAPASSVNSAVPNQSSDSTESSGSTTKNKNTTQSTRTKGANTSTGTSTKNEGTKASRGTYRSTNSYESTGTSENKGSSTSTGTSTENTGSNSSVGTSTENKGTNSSTGTSTESKSTNSSTGTSSENTGSNASTKTPTGNTGSSTSTGVSTQNKGASTSTGTSTGNTGN